ncbi:MAG: hypothetical protein U5N56_11975 [Candidatus Marinimicrobia bacterium]|nr:hypothetical protein [Candidatus Neomarinimicrobiota bacterium]
MKKILVVFLLFSGMAAGEGLPVLTLPDMAQDGYFPSIPVKPTNGISFSYAEWYYDTDYSVIAVNYNDYYLGFKGLMSGDIAIRDEQPSTEPVGTTTYYNTVLYAGRSWELDDHWTVNTAVKLLNERLFYASSWGGAVDAEAVWTFNVRYRALAGVENIGFMTPLNEVPTKIPSRYYLGGDVAFNFFIISLKAGVNGDFDPYYRTGVRYTHPVFDISYTFDNLLQTHHLGADIKWNGFRVGYGQFIHREGLGNPMMFTFGMQF